MTRPARAKKNSLVLDGNEIKVRLEAERTASGSVVHVDWLRFTCQLRSAPAPSVDDLFPKPKTTSIYDSAYAMAQIRQVLSMIPDEDFAPAAQALELGRSFISASHPSAQRTPEAREAARRAYLAALAEARAAVGRGSGSWRAAGRHEAGPAAHRGQQRAVVSVSEPRWRRPEMAPSASSGKRFWLALILPTIERIKTSVASS